MNAPQENMINADIKASMQATLETQRSSYLDEGRVTAGTRIDRLDRAIDALVRHSETISKAMEVGPGRSIS
jgi:coniferyl-aldehyde dehydrogenase